MVKKTTHAKYLNLPQIYLLWLPCLIEEAGEVAKLFRKIEVDPEKMEEVKDKIKEEVGDVIVTCCLIATSCGISMEDLLNGSIEKFQKRYGVENETNGQ